MRYIIRSRALLLSFVAALGCVGFAQRAIANISAHAAVAVIYAVVQEAAEQDTGAQDNDAGEDAFFESVADRDGIQPRDQYIEPRDSYIEPLTYTIEPRQYYIEPRAYCIEPRQVLVEPRQVLIEPRYPDIVPRSFQPRFPPTRNLHIPLHYKYPPLPPLPESDPEFEDDMALEEAAADDIE